MLDHNWSLKTYFLISLQVYILLSLKHGVDIGLDPNNSVIKRLWCIGTILSKGQTMGLKQRSGVMSFDFLFASFRLKSPTHFEIMSTIIKGKRNDISHSLDNYHSQKS